MNLWNCEEVKSYTWTYFLLRDYFLIFYSKSLGNIQDILPNDAIGACFWLDWDFQDLF